CFSSKGGIGRTTTAVNLAVSLHNISEKPVVLVDLDLEGGDDAMFLNLRPQYSISDVTTNIARVDQTFLNGVLSKHRSGIYLLAEPQNIEEVETITPGQVRDVLEALRNIFAYVVVDTGIGYSERNLAAFDISDLTLLIGILSLPSLHNVQKALAVFNRLGYDMDKVKFIVNRYVRKGEISISDAERTLGCKVFKHLPNDFNGVITSINRGLPLTLMAPKSEISRSFNELAAETQDLLGETVKGETVMAMHAAA
ncbi:MAG: AAA family ATPase, partial [Nitrospirota bacterium]